ncbi:helix-turn-helix domain-containing protein, partial [Streptomyces zhihengii]|uniref:helix-turn-helix domain-containing protein n=1 Tax=Streptomyces zhihengii TaxID=1818004 RepID=UPI0034564618
MPGGRLTQQERQRIAAGLADGLSYAEIGRRLERPTSTISREVSRNGGPGRYRPQQAHLATVRRARRGTVAGGVRLLAARTWSSSSASPGSASASGPRC